MSGTRPLFVYGTLADPELRARIVGEVERVVDATLDGFALRQAEGFYFVRPAEGERVSGLVLWLDAEQLARADRWEDVPLYRRVRAPVASAGGTTQAWVYVRTDVEGEPVSPGARGIAALDRDHILRMLDALDEPDDPADA